jgi:SAM-dependent methyltransferase
MKKTSDLLSEVSAYYSEKLAQHGDTPQGVDWNGEISQSLRFEQLTKIISKADKFSIADIGCGYGALLDFLNSKFRDFSYLGIDISPSMIRKANCRYTSESKSRFIVANESDTQVDYTIASGVFNVRLEQTHEAWYEYIIQTLDSINSASREGFSFNCLTSYSDPDKKRDYLYYADPCKLFDLCKKKYSKQVALLHDYGLYEFTILVRK